MTKEQVDALEWALNAAWADWDGDGDGPGKRWDAGAAEGEVNEQFAAARGAISAARGELGSTTTIRLLAEISNIGTQDIYTDAIEYDRRTSAMHDLCHLAGRAAAGETVTDAELADAILNAHDVCDKCHQESTELVHVGKGGFDFLCPNCIGEPCS